MERSCSSEITVPVGFSGELMQTIRAVARYGASWSTVGMKPFSARVGTGMPLASTIQQ